MDLKKSLQQTSDQDLHQAAEKLWEYPAEVQSAIQAELIARGMLESPTLVGQIPSVSPSRLTQQLLAHYKTTVEDFALNKQGRLSTRQKKMIQSNSKSGLIFSEIFVFGFAAVLYGFLFFILNNSPGWIQKLLSFSDGSVWWQSLPFFLIFGLATTLIYLGIRGLITAWQSRNVEQVKCLEGPIQLRSYRIKFTWFYELKIQKHKFYLLQGTYALLTRVNECRVYYEPITKSIVAIEPKESPW